MPNPKDPNNWGKIAAIIITVLYNGTERAYKGGPAFIRTLNIKEEIVEVAYRIMEGIIKISDSWVK